LVHRAILAFWRRAEQALRRIGVQRTQCSASHRPVASERSHGRHGIDDFGVVPLAIEALRTWRFLVLFQADTQGVRVAFHLWSRVRTAAQNRLYSPANTSI
jgi:hypothetical protein